MSHTSFTGSSPWTVLGVSETASSQDIREAYRKLALRWHPDQNNGCSIARDKFQRIKEAFEEIQRLQQLPRHQRPTGHSSSYTSNAHYQHGYYRTSGSYNASSASSYRYRKPQSETPNFYDVRRDARNRSKSWSWATNNTEQHHQNTKYSSPFEYARDTHHSNNHFASRSDWHRTWNVYSARSRFAPAVGVGLASIVVLSTVGVCVLGTDVLWRANNKGKSFEDLMKTLDERHDEQQKQRKRKRPSIPS